ncbi:hypothetical protein DFH27DRAFT_459274, partial [Peziza echinospora]
RLCRLYTFLLSKCLTQWAEAEDCLPPTQIGFRKGHRTTNNLFLLQTLVNHSLISLKTPLYLVLVDLTKAFNLVNRQILFYLL